MVTLHCNVTIRVIRRIRISDACLRDA
jgi:hypothetical protein